MWAAYGLLKEDHAAEPNASRLKAPDHTYVKCKKKADDEDFKNIKMM